MTNPLTIYRRAETQIRQWAHTKRVAPHCVLCYLVRSLVTRLTRLGVPV